MKRKRIFIIILIICGLHLQINCQILNVKSKMGTHNSYIISSIKNMTFSAGNIKINKKDLTSHSFAINAVHNMFFSSDILNKTTEMRNNLNSKLSLYPNPAIDVMSCQFYSESMNEVQIEIIDLQGRVVFQQKFCCQDGNQFENINVSELKHGLYLLRLHFDNKIESSKFLKN